MASIFQLLKKIKRVNFFKTIYFNYKVLPINKAIKFPFFICYNTKLLSIKGPFLIKGEITTGMIIIGNHVVGIYDRKNQRTLIKVNSLVEFQGKAQIGSGSRISVEQNAKLTIGKNFHNTADIKIVCANNITIGENVTVSWNVIIMDTDWHQTMNVNTGLKNPVSRPIRISSNNWIGFNCIILKGTETNDYCIVSSNSLLNKKYNNLPVNSIIAGSPAKLVKENIRRC